MSNKENMNMVNLTPQSMADDITVFKARPSIDTNCNLTNTQQNIETVNKPKNMVSSPQYAFQKINQEKMLTEDTSTEDKKTLCTGSKIGMVLLENSISFET